MSPGGDPKALVERRGHVLVPTLDRPAARGLLAAAGGVFRTACAEKRPPAWKAR